MLVKRWINHFCVFAFARQNFKFQEGMADKLDRQLAIYPERNNITNIILSDDLTITMWPKFKETSQYMNSLNLGHMVLV